MVTLILKNDLFLCASIPYVILHKYQYVVQPDRLNYGAIRTYLREGLSISTRDDKGKTTGLERK